MSYSQWLGEDYHEWNIFYPQKFSLSNNIAKWTVGPFCITLFGPVSIISLIEIGPFDLRSREGKNILTQLADKPFNRVLVHKDSHLEIDYYSNKLSCQYQSGYIAWEFYGEEPEVCRCKYKSTQDGSCPWKD